ncbi:MAG: glycosyltransferase [Rickettsiales bacterium]|jgi:glycosyltransferase involved in cell wall biosynthesis|nr:glycosyltransferase [Rickettsiales bacterium]
MGNPVKISVVVPAYNAERNLRGCVDSILRQDFGAIEVILVDDGSKDGTGALCDEYARSDGRVRALHQKNGGVAKARNAGVAMARGEYVGFVDADDWIERKMFGVLYVRAAETKADIAMCDYWREGRLGSGSRPHVDAAFLDAKVFDKDTLAREPARKSFFATAVCWNKIFRRSFYIKNVRFSEDSAISEDVATMFAALARARRISALGRKLYHYRVSDSGGSHERGRRIFGLFDAAKIVLADMEKNDYGMFAGLAVRGMVHDELRHFGKINTGIRREYFAKFLDVLSAMERQGLLCLLGRVDAFKAWCARRLGYRAFCAVAWI